METKQPSDDLRFLDLLGLPRRPAFLATSVGAIKSSLILAGSPVAALVIAVTVWLSPSPGIAAVVKYAVWIPVAMVVFIGWKYLWGVYRYFIAIKASLLRLRTTVLMVANINDPGPAGNFRFCISGIADQSGTVQIVLDHASSRSVRLGACLTVVATDTRDEWGTVRVVQFIEGLARAEVTDRKRPEFWESLEDRMKTDPSPPTGFHLEPNGLRRLGELLRG